MYRGRSRSTELPLQDHRLHHQSRHLQPNERDWRWPGTMICQCLSCLFDRRGLGGVSYTAINVRRAPIAASPSLGDETHFLHDSLYLINYLCSHLDFISASMEVESPIPQLLADQRDNAPDDLAHYFLTFEDYWEKKLWHELTELLLEFFRNQQSASQRLPLYRTFIKSFADKINQLNLVSLGLSAASQIHSMHFSSLYSFSID